MEELPIGIDLGTTNSVIGVWDKKQVSIIPNTIGENLTPSIVYFDNSKPIVGEQTEIYGPDADKRIYAIKRLIGKSFKDEELKEDIKILQYNVVEEKDKNNPLVKIIDKGTDHFYTPVQISSYILQKLVKDAEKFLQRKIKNVVITTPAYFNNSQRDCTKKAAEDIGLNVLRIINEPTAAALAYGLGKKFCPLKVSLNERSVELLTSEQEEIDNPNPYTEENDNPYKQEENNYCLLGENKKYNKISRISLGNINSVLYDNPRNLLVFDLGGGTFDLTIIRIEKNKFEVKTTMGDRHLGGEDFDTHLVEYFLKIFCSRMNLKIDEVKNNYKKEIARLKIACEHIKRVLSHEEETSIKLDNFIQNSDLLERISREQFETEICSDLFNKIPVFFPIILNEAHMSNKDIDEIILVGGSTKMPKIKSILSDNFPDSIINDNINPDEIVAYGATIQAAIILQDIKSVNLFDVTSFSYGTDIVNDSKDPIISAKGYKMSILLPKGTSIPYSFTKGYKTAYDNQKSMLICIYEGENEYVKDNHFLGKFELVNLPQRPMGKVEVYITFSVDVNNLLTVNAVEKSEGISNSLQIVRTDRNSTASKNPNLESMKSIRQLKINKSEIENKDYLIKYCQDFRKENNKENKLKILQNYKEVLLNIIRDFNPDSFNNEMILEKYFIYVSQLFQSYNEELKIINEKNKNSYLEEEIYPKIIQFLEDFKNKSLYYIKNLVNIFKSSIKFSDIFYRIIAYILGVFNQKGQNYLDKKQQYSRYRAKLYFSEAIKYYDENIKEFSAIMPFNTSREIEKQNEISNRKLKEISSNALILIKLAQEKKEIFDPVKFENEFGFSGFSLLKNKFMYSVQSTIEEYNIALDAFEKALSELQSSSRDSKINDENLQEGKAICMGNIVKINYVFLGGKNFKRYKNLIDDCLAIAQNLEKDNDDCSWYKDACELEQKIKEKLQKEEEEFNRIWNEKWEPRLTQIKNTLDKIFSNNNKIEFINHILEVHPYKGYNLTNKYTSQDYNKSLIDFLRNKYHLDQYSQNTLEEKFNYCIYQMISEKLNVLYNDFK